MELEEGKPESQIITAVPKRLDLGSLGEDRVLRLRPFVVEGEGEDDEVDRVHRILGVDESHLAFSPEEVSGIEAMFRKANGGRVPKSVRRMLHDPDWLPHDIRQMNRFLKREFKKGREVIPESCPYPAGKVGLQETEARVHGPALYPLGHARASAREVQADPEEGLQGAVDFLDYKFAFDETLPRLNKSIDEVLQLQEEYKFAKGNNTRMEEFNQKRAAEYDRIHGTERIYVKKPLTDEQLYRMKFAWRNNMKEWEDIEPDPSVFISRERVMELIPMYGRFGELTRNIYVRNIDRRVTETMMRGWLEQYGPLESLQMCNSEVDGLFMGSAFATFRNRSDAVDALRLSGHKIMGRLIRVQMQKPTKLVYAFGIPEHVDERTVRRFLGGGSGNVFHLTWIKEGGNFTGMAAVEFMTTDMALKAVKENFGRELSGKAIRLELGRLPRLDEERRNTEITALTLGNIPRDTTEEQIRAACQEFGPIRSIKMWKNYTSGWTTLCHLEYESPEDLRRAVDHLKGTQINGRFARILPGHTSLNVWVFNLSKQVTETDLYGTFNSSGPIVDLTILDVKERPTNAARLTFLTLPAAINALNKAGMYINKGMSKLKVEFARPRLLQHYYSRPRRPEVEPPLPKKWLQALGRKEKFKIGLSEARLAKRGLKDPERNVTPAIPPKRPRGRDRRQDVDLEPETKQLLKVPSKFYGSTISTPEDKSVEEIGEELLG
eukprot:CAMPEP_0114486344 /NCGR_PEP_ID=MMETSP0109-20121206/166_1 /TAXON_ID=29199 /ORGANISM="Chlorarachnion reptans, Strain CCCM449" /LENGTH=720 /DNA_ID=CAMNT_0001662503 /DNA_START=18 /DNA_END=2182 /DNA_ORIENTATION=+